MLDAERAEIVLFSDVGSRLAYRTVVTVEGTDMTMFPVVLTEEERELAGYLAENTAGVLDQLPGLGFDTEAETKDAVSAPLLGSAGPLGYLLVANRLDDVSTFVGADARLLETLAGHLTVSLENGRLEDSLEELTRLKDQLEQEVKSKDEFVASVSHELRTPLTGIVGLSHELVENREYFEQDEINDILMMISEQSSELANIVEDLLVGARADSSTLVIKKETIDLQKEIQMVVSGHALLGSEGHPEVPVTIRTNGAHADALRFRQIVRNLLTNAARYGGSKVWIETRREAGRVVVAVIDNGEGVPGTQETSIFEAYQRAHNAAGQPASVGLGLSVARKLARKMGGDLRYRRIDDTSSFELSLPLTSADSPTPSG
jgi:K+-sensing histidine kinase KdpD